MNREETLKKIRLLDLEYVSQGVGHDPARLPHHLADYIGYASILYDHYSEFIKSYTTMEGKVTAEENDDRTQQNIKATTRDEKVSMAEVEQRIDVRLSELKGERKRLEIAVKGATLHINGCQTLMKTWGDEAKGLR